jgi:hypothetical protein
VSTLLVEAVLVHRELSSQLLLLQLALMVEDMADMALPQVEPPQAVLHQVALSPANQFQVYLLLVDLSQLVVQLLVALLPVNQSQSNLLQAADMAQFPLCLPQSPLLQLNHPRLLLLQLLLLQLLLPQLNHLRSLLPRLPLLQLNHLRSLLPQLPLLLWLRPQFTLRL